MTMVEREDSTRPDDRSRPMPKEEQREDSKKDWRRVIEEAQKHRQKPRKGGQ